MFSEGLYVTNTFSGLTAYEIILSFTFYNLIIACLTTDFFEYILVVDH